MQIALKDGDIFIREMTPEQYAIIKGWNLTKWVKAERHLRGKANMELLDKLDGICKLPPHIQEYRYELHKTAELVNLERNKENPEELVKYPVKKKLFMHQVRAANMALLVFGFDPFKGDFV